MSYRLVGVVLWCADSVVITRIDSFESSIVSCDGCSDPVKVEETI